MSSVHFGASPFHTEVYVHESIGQYVCFQSYALPRTFHPQSDAHNKKDSEFHGRIFDQVRLHACIRIILKRTLPDRIFGYVPVVSNSTTAYKVVP